MAAQAAFYGEVAGLLDLKQAQYDLWIDADGLDGYGEFPWWIEPLRLTVVWPVSASAGCFWSMALRMTAVLVF